VTVIVVDGNDAGVVDRFGDTERAGTVVAGCGLVADGLIEIVVVVVLVFQFRDPLRPGTIEDEFEVVVGVLGELFAASSPLTRRPRSL